MILPNSETSTIAGSEIEASCTRIISNFESAMCDDLNTPRAVAEVFSLVAMAEKLLLRGELTVNQAEYILKHLQKMDEVFGLFYEVPLDYFGSASGILSDVSVQGNSVPVEVMNLAQLRFEAKKIKNFALADSFRDQILAAGYTVKDTKDGFDVSTIET